MPLPATDEVLERLHPGLRRWLRQESGWSGLSPIQRAAIPPILDGEDCVVEAPTAGGKTEAVLFPALTRAAADAEAAGDSPPSVRVLYLAPLRALLNNLELRGEHYAELCALRAFKWHGDVDQQEKVAALRDAPHLLLTTPESVEAILLRKAERASLFAGLAMVIIDEAHNFAAGDRGGQLLSLVERVAAAAAKPVQRVALSATLGDPQAMLRWLAGAGRRPGRRVFVATTEPKDRDFLVRFFDEDHETEQTPPEQRAAYRRFSALWHSLSGGPRDERLRSLVFVPSRAKTEDLARAFGRANAGLPAARRLRVRTHHSAVSKFFREEAEALIQAASEEGLHAILSTSTLELGIDIGELNQVIQMDTLASPSSFLQRVGRTGRRPGRPQFFRGLTDDLDGLLLLTAAVNLGLAGRCEALLLPSRAFHLLAHQLLCLSLESHGISPRRAWATLGRAHCFSGVRDAEVDQLVEHMVAQEFLRDVDGDLVVGAATEKHYLHSNWRRLFAVFDSAPLYEVWHRKLQVGTLDAKFVEGIEHPFYFVLGGKLWHTDRVDSSLHRVLAHPSDDGQAPSWVSFGGPGVPFETAQEVGRLVHSDEVPTFLDSEAGEAFRSAQVACAGDGWKPGRIAWTVSASGRARLVTYTGDRINRTLARLLAIEGLGDATASYAEVNVKRPGDREEVIREVERILGDLRSGRWTESSLTSVLETSQPLWPFSPFARCLPEPLWASALAEQTLDPAGLLRLGTMV